MITPSRAVSAHFYERDAIIVPALYTVKKRGGFVLVFYDYVTV